MLTPGCKEASTQTSSRFFDSVSLPMKVGALSLRSLWMECFIFPKAPSVLPTSFTLLTRPRVTQEGWTLPLGTEETPGSPSILCSMDLSSSYFNLSHHGWRQLVCTGTVLPVVKDLNITRRDLPCTGGVIPHHSMAPGLPSQLFHAHALRGHVMGHRITWRTHSWTGGDPHLG